MKPLSGLLVMMSQLAKSSKLDRSRKSWEGHFVVVKGGAINNA